MLPATLQSGRWSWHTGCLVFKRSDQIKKIKWGQMSQKISVKNIDGHRNDVNQVLTIFRHLKRDYFIQNFMRMTMKEKNELKCHTVDLF